MARAISTWCKFERHPIYVCKGIVDGIRAGISIYWNMQSMYSQECNACHNCQSERALRAKCTWRRPSRCWWKAPCNTIWWVPSTRKRFGRLHHTLLYLCYSFWSKCILKICKLLSIRKGHNGRKLRAVRYHNSGEYISAKMKSFIADHGAMPQLELRGKSKQNAIAERFNRTLLGLICSMLCQKKHEESFELEIWRLLPIIVVITRLVAFSTECKSQNHLRS